MRVVLVYNPVAGKGKASHWARVLSRDLTRDGHDVVAVDVGPDRDPHRLESELGSADLLVAIGGDGTVQAHAPIVARHNVPLYQFPLGTENLFAREFGMDRRYESLRRAIEGGEIVRVDLARCNGDPFLLMCSIGPDANIVHRLATNRTGPINHMSYARHVIHELIRPGLKDLHIEVDGEEVVSGRSGLAVVANSRQYALRIDPARHASMTDGRLDVVFFPVTKRIGLLKWLGLSRLRHQHIFPGAVIRQGNSISIRNGSVPLPFQLDGEAQKTRELGGGALSAPEINLEIDAAIVPVLVPDR